MLETLELVPYAKENNRNSQVYLTILICIISFVCFPEVITLGDKIIVMPALNISH